MMCVAMVRASGLGQWNSEWHPARSSALPENRPGSLITEPTALEVAEAEAACEEEERWDGLG